jgi:hypothetical protein
MSVDLKRLPEDEELVRSVVPLGRYGPRVQNVLDALNYYRCKAKFAEQELKSANETLTAMREGAEFRSWS